MAPKASSPSAVPFPYSTLESIVETDNHQTIVVRLLRTWEVRDYKRNHVLMSVDLLLLDEKSNAIHASIHPRRLHKFRSKLTEGGLFTISVFDVKKNPNSYRLADHQYKLLFNDQTTMDVFHSKKVQIPHAFFRIQSYNDIEATVGKGENLPDIVVQVTCIRNSDKVDDSTTPPKTTFNLILACVFDSGEKAYVSVWDKLACKIRQDLQNVKGEPIVLIVTALNAKNIRGELYLNATASSRFYWNVDNNITQTFRKSIHFQELLNPTCEDEDNNSVPTDIHSIQQILSYVNEQSGKEARFWCKAKIVDLILCTGWFFISCTQCFKKMKYNGHTIVCGECGTGRAIGRLRFRIEVIVDDGCENTTFVIFDEAAQKLLKTTASALAAINNVAENDDCGLIVPSEIQNIIGGDFVFYIKVAAFNFTAKNQSFSVTKMVNPSPAVTKKRNDPAQTSPEGNLGDTSASTKPNLKKPRPNSKKKQKMVLQDSEDEVDEDDA